MTQLFFLQNNWDFVPAIPISMFRRGVDSITLQHLRHSYSPSSTRFTYSTSSAWWCICISEPVEVACVAGTRSNHENTVNMTNFTSAVSFLGRQNQKHEETCGNTERRLPFCRWLIGVPGSQHATVPHFDCVSKVLRHVEGVSILWANWLVYVRFSDLIRSCCLLGAEIEPLCPILLQLKWGLWSVA